MATKHGLARGLDALLPETDLPAGVTEIAVSQLDPNPDQPRRTFDTQALEALAESIRQAGVLQPLLVVENGARYRIVAGERRYRASKMAGLTEVPVIVLDKSDLETAQISLIENIQREDLNPVEEAQAYRALIDSYNLTQEEVSAKVGKGRSTITNALRLLDLSDDVVAMLNAGELSAGHARALLSLKDKSREREVAAKIVSGGLSVRAAEDLVKKENRAAAAAAESDAEAPELGLEIDYYAELEKKAMGMLGRRVKISHRGISKHVTISYEDNEDLEILLTKLCGNGIIES